MGNYSGSGSTGGADNEIGITSMTMTLQEKRPAKLTEQ